MKTVNKFRQTNITNQTMCEIERLMEMTNWLKKDQSVKSIIAVVSEMDKNYNTRYTVRLVDILGNLVDVLVTRHTHATWLILDQETIHRADVSKAA